MNEIILGVIVVVAIVGIIAARKKRSKDRKNIPPVPKASDGSFPPDPTYPGEDEVNKALKGVRENK